MSIEKNIPPIHTSQSLSYEPINQLYSLSINTCVFHNVRTFWAAEYISEQICFLKQNFKSMFKTIFCNISVASQSIVAQSWIAAPGVALKV